MLLYILVFYINGFSYRELLILAVDNTASVLSGRASRLLLLVASFRI